ncbi:MAG: hypothetical protein ACLPKE_32900 [Streptosporangiaceae bacterium]
MPTLTQSILTYSYIDRPTIDLGTIDTTNTDIALLVRVNSLMASAASAYNAREYDDAIQDYHAAESLIYTNLDPQWEPELGPKIRPLLPRTASLFQPLLSATSQWLNILPVSGSVSPVRPTVSVAGNALASVSNLHGAGLNVVSSNPAATSEALADVQLAAIYSGQGNTTASSSVVARAETLDPTTTKAFGFTPPTPTPTPVPVNPLPIQPKPVAQVTTTPAVAVPGVTARAAAPTQAAPAENGGEAVQAVLAPSAAIGTPQLSAITLLPVAILAQKQVGLLTGTQGNYAVQAVQWPASGSPDVSQITTLLYAPHVTATTLPDSLTGVSTLWERAALLPHDYFYVIPLALAASYEAIGDYATAEEYYLQAAAYTYINTAIEGPYVWVALANLYSTWGDSVYEQGDLTTAAQVYGKVLTVGSTAPPATPLYTLAGLSVAVKIATSLIPQLSTLASSGVSTVSSEDTAIASVLLKINAKLSQINAGLDFWGGWANAIPIWPFSYLQQVATSFGQLALNAEQEVINYWSQADQATLTQVQLQNQAAQANAQVAIAQDQLSQAQAQAVVYQAGLTLAQQRATDAAANASQYQAQNSQAIVLEAEAQQNNGGDSGDWQQVTSLAAQLLAGQTISADTATLAASANLAANQLSQQYQVDSMNRTAAEMQGAATQAQAQLTAANAQVNAAAAGVGAAALDAATAAQAVAVFNADTFTPQVWKSMGDYLAGIYGRYMQMALAAAKLMQQAYNFENDTSVTYIKDSYPGVVQGLLAADGLMADIQQFSYDLITSKRGKQQYVKTSISLAQNYGYLFRTQLVANGEMTFETTLDDFDSAFPGSYGGRIKSVSVDIQGIVPPTGISGTLANGGISFYRLPSDIATPANPSRLRIQDSDTLILSDYNQVIDPQLNSSTGNQLGIFEGAGVASTWTLSLPKQLNDIDYGTLTDVVLTFLYETRFDPQLVPTVLSQLASRPGYNDRQWAIPIAWLYPDLFYGFMSSGSLTLPLSSADFPLNQTSPAITAVSLLVNMAPGTSEQGITISITPPGKSAASGVTGSGGTITSQGTGSPWAGVTGGSALGNWVISLSAASNPGLAPGGVLNLSALQNLVLVLDYSFTPRS